MLRLRPCLINMSVKIKIIENPAWPFCRNNSVNDLTLHRTNPAQDLPYVNGIPQTEYAYYKGKPLKGINPFFWVKKF
jgi:hypothetical protein